MAIHFHIPCGWLDGTWCAEQVANGRRPTGDTSGDKSSKSGVEGEGKAPMGRRKAVAGWWMATWEPPPRAVRNRLQVGGGDIP
jgi:hypothetical protein